MGYGLSFFLVFLGAVLSGVYLIWKLRRNEQIKMMHELSLLRDFFTNELVRQLIFRPCMYTVLSTGILGWFWTQRIDPIALSMFTFFLSVISGFFLWYSHDMISLAFNIPAQSHETIHVGRRIDAHLSHGQRQSAFSLLVRVVLQPFGVFALHVLSVYGAYRAILKFNSPFASVVLFAGWNLIFCALSLLLGRISSQEKETVT
jgi:hypothetical protein